MYSLEYLLSVDTDLEEAEIYLGEFSPTAPNKLSEAFEKQTAQLAEHPFMYPISKFDDSLRCMPLPYQYLCFYHVKETEHLVQVLRVLRSMRNITVIL